MLHSQRRARSRTLVSAEGADWFEIADEHSDDTGSGVARRRPRLVDPENSQFVAEFATALAALEVGEVSEPIRTEFGYHIIQKTGERDSPQAEAAELVEQLRADPDSFARGRDPGERGSRDGARRTASWAGWPHTSSPRSQEEAVFALTEVGEISDAVDAGGRRHHASTSCSRRATAGRSRPTGSRRSAARASSAGLTRRCARRGRDVVRRGVRAEHRHHLIR